MKKVVAGKKIIGALLSGSLAMLTLNGCGWFDGNKKQNHKIKKYFVHGDPGALYAGAVLDKKSFFNKENLDKFADFDFVGGAFYLEKERTQEPPGGDVEAGNEATSEDTSDERLHYDFIEQDDRYYYFDEDQWAKQEGVGFELTPANGKLAFTAVVLGQTRFPVEVIHYSVKDDQSAFSLLAKGNDEDGKFLLALFFTKNFPASDPISDVDKKFNYILGPGVRARWVGDINTSICGEVPAGYADLVRDGIEAWSSGRAFENAKVRLPIKVTETLRHRPFSDVNEHCIQVVDNFYFETSDHSAVGGETIPIINKTSREIVTSHVFISKSGIDKRYKGESLTRQMISRISVHEYGHFLGLDHEFERTPDGDEYKHPSVMGYDPDVVEIQPHDVEAIEALYAE